MKKITSALLLSALFAVIGCKDDATHFDGVNTQGGSGVVTKEFEAKVEDAYLKFLVANQELGVDVSSYKVLKVAISSA